MADQIGERRLYINGELREASNGATFDNINPATEESLGVVADGTAEDMDAAIAAARRTFDETSWATDHAFRAKCLRQLHEALVARGVSHRLAFVLLSAVQLVPRMQARAAAILQAQQARGLSIGGSPVRRLRALVPEMPPSTHRAADGGVDRR